MQMFAKTLNTTGKTHMTLEMDESLPTVTEGVPVRNHHHHHHLSSANIIAGTGDQSATSIGSTAASSLRSKLASKRNSVDDTTTTSCSSSTSLDGSSSGGCSVGGGRLSRRRSSTVSQCSSVLSEGTRQQLNFDLSPDLPLDSSILDANTISPVDDFERPASPEPSSELALLDGNSNEDECSFDLRPISRMSGTFCSSAGGDDDDDDDEEDQEIMLTNADSPDSTLGDSNKEPVNIAATNQVAALDASPIDSRQQEPQVNSSEQHEINIRDNLERIISHVSTVRVSCGSASDEIAREPHETMAVGVSIAGQKRAHTPFGLNIQRNKTTHMSPATPSPTAHLSDASSKIAAAAATCE